MCVDFVPCDFWSYGPIGSTSHILHDQCAHGLVGSRTPRALRLDLDDQGPWNRRGLWIDRNDPATRCHDCSLHAHHSAHAVYTVLWP